MDLWIHDLWIMCPWTKDAHELKAPHVFKSPWIKSPSELSLPSTELMVPLYWIKPPSTELSPPPCIEFSLPLLN